MSVVTSARSPFARPLSGRLSSRALTLFVGGALAAASVLTVAPPASAAALTSAELKLSTDFGADGAPTCGASDPGAEVTTPFTANGTAVTRSISGTETVTDSADLSDVTTLHASAKSTVRATQAAGSLKSMKLTTTARASVNQAAGIASSCEASVVGSALVQALFTLAQPGWITLNITTTQGGISQVQVLNATEPTLILLSQNVKSTQTKRAFLPAGDYIMGAVFGTVLSSPDSANDPTSKSGTGTITVDFAPAGSAPAASVGKGGSFVSLADSRSCGTGSLKTTWKSKASQVAKATYLVNGKKVKTVKTPAKGSSVVLKHLAGGDPAAVTVQLALKSGKKTSVSRSYVSCS